MSSLVHRLLRSLLARAIAIPLALAVVQACASTQSPEVVEESQPSAVAPPPIAVMQSLLPALVELDSGEFEAEEARFDVIVNNAPVRELFISLVQDTPYDITLHPKVSGHVSLSLRDATIETVLQSLRSVYGYDYRRTGKSIVILPAGPHTRIFNVDYLNIRREAHTSMRVSAGGMTQTVGGDGKGAARRGTNTTSGSRVDTLTEANFWEELIGNLKELIPSGGGRSVVASPHTGVIAVRAMPEELDIVSDYLDAIKASLGRQVILEAKILEVELHEGYETGINWTALAVQSDRRYRVTQTSGKAANLLEGVDGDAGDLDLSDLAALASNASPYGGMFSLAIRANKFSAMVDLLETQGEVRTLSNPRIATLNNQRAMIKVGSDEFFVTDISTTTVTGTSTTTNPNITLTPFFSGIALDVTPQISSDGHVILHIHPSVTEVIDQEKRISLGDQPVTIPLALSRMRESDSIVSARSGQIVVIGGLMQNSSRKDRAAPPILGKIPLLRHLVTQRRGTSRLSELVILLRPIVVDAGAWDAGLRTVADRVERLSPAWIDSYDAREFGLEGWIAPVPRVEN